MGGAEVTSLSLIDVLITNKIKTTLYCIKSPDIEQTNLFSIHQIKQKKFPMFWRYQRMTEVKSLFNSVSNENILFVMSGGLTLEKSNAKLVYVYCHSSFSRELEFVKRKFHGIRGIYYKIIQNSVQKSIELLKNKDIKLISNSNFTKTEIKKNFDKDSCVIYPPVDINKFYNISNKQKESKVITISRFSVEKNLESVIEIFNNTDFFCELIGSAKHKNQFKILENLQKVKGKNVKIYNNVSPQNIIELLATAKVYLHTSKETFGISVVESIASGCIPIVPDNSAHKETVPFEELRYKDNEDAVKKISDAMHGKFDDLQPKLFKHIQKFSSETFQKNIIELIKKN
jgi:glycosyltransferase involved in cell wall biosynthesis